MSPADKRILIVGGTSGIGRAAAGLLAARGDRVILASRTADKVEVAVSELGGEACGLVMDMRDPESVSDAVASIGDGTLDALVVTASTVGHGRFEETDVADVEATLRPTVAAVITREDRLPPPCRPGTPTPSRVRSPRSCRS